MKNKIIFIIPYLTKGGAQRVVTNLSNHFINKGFAVSILILNKCEIGYILDDRIKVVFVIKGRNSGVLSRISNTFKTFFRIFSIIRKESPDCVVSFITSANIWNSVICSLLRIPYFVSERTVVSRTIDKYNYLSKKIVQRMYARSKGLIVPSLGMGKEFQDKYNLKNVKVIRNPVSPFAALTNQQVHPKPFILAVGRLNYVKGFDLLIEGFSLIKSKGLDLVIVGDGKERENLTQLIYQKGLGGSVFLPGRKSNIQDYYSQCSMFVLSSRNEGYPNVLIEAMSLGCASVSFDCETGPSEIIKHGENGLLVPNRQVEGLAEAIDLLIRDEDLKTNIMRQAIRIGQANSMEEIAREWETLILRQDND